MTRPSIHVEPRGAVAIARHYPRDLGANNGVITFAVVSSASRRRDIRGIGRRGLGAAPALCDTGLPWAGIRLISHVDVSLASCGRRGPNGGDYRSLVDSGTRGVSAGCDCGGCRVRRGSARGLIHIVNRA